MRRPGETDGAGPLSPLERAVLRTILAADQPGLAALREQSVRATCAGRTHSGVGFVTRLAVPADAAAAPLDSAKSLRPALAHHPALAEPAEFLLQIRDGRLATLEAFCHEGAWPADESGFTVLAPAG